MISPYTRLSLRIPGSPIEKQAFRSRSFRKLFISGCVSLLFIASIHNINQQQDLRQRGGQDYFLSFHADSISAGWLSRLRSEDAQGWLTKTILGSEESNPDHRLEQLMDKLPEVVRIPFEAAVQDVELDGWEDEWFSSATYDKARFGNLTEPKIDFVYNWVNGSEKEFRQLKHKYELSSPLKNKKGWMDKHSINRYRDWGELKYSFRSLEKYAQSFTNKIQLLVNSVSNSTGEASSKPLPQIPHWLKGDALISDAVQILAQEDFFGEVEKECLPSFDSLSIEAQIHNTPSDVDQMVALSDDMFLGASHSAADFYSPLFGSMLAFKPNHYNVKNIKNAEVPTFGEKPHLYYTSWLLNHRFGERDRKVQAHFTHSVSRRVLKEAMASFPSPALRGSCERFRGETKFQIYPWYTAFHYSIERFREALLWSFVMSKSDINGDGYLDWTERQAMLDGIRPGRRMFDGEDASTPVKTAANRDRLFYQVPVMHQQAGLQPPLSNFNVLWTSLDGPETIRDVKCHNFHVNKCFAESFDSAASDSTYENPEFTTANIFTQLSQRGPACGDCVIKYLLSTATRGLEPMLPPKTKPRKREVVVKALLKYQHTIFVPDAMFVMVKDVEQAKVELLDRAITKDKAVGQWCLNDDVMTEDVKAVEAVRNIIQTFYTTLFPDKGKWEK